jgi:hypothetical protein
MLFIKKIDHNQALEEHPNDDASSWPPRTFKSSKQTCVVTALKAGLYNNNDELLVYIPKSTKIAIIAESHEWYKVRYRHHTGFVRKKSTQ